MYLDKKEKTYWIKITSEELKKVQRTDDKISVDVTRFIADEIERIAADMQQAMHKAVNDVSNDLLKKLTAQQVPERSDDYSLLKRKRRDPAQREKHKAKWEEERRRLFTKHDISDLLEKYAEAKKSLQNKNSEDNTLAGWEKTLGVSLYDYLFEEDEEVCE